MKGIRISRKINKIRMQYLNRLVFGWRGFTCGRVPPLTGHGAGNVYEPRAAAHLLVVCTVRLVIAASAMYRPRAAANSRLAIVVLESAVAARTFVSSAVGQRAVWNIWISAHCKRCTLARAFYEFIPSWNSYNRDLIDIQLCIVTFALKGVLWRAFIYYQQCASVSEKEVMKHQEPSWHSRNTCKHKIAHGMCALM